MKKALKTVALLGALVLATGMAGCGGSDTKDDKPKLSADEKKVVANLSASFSSMTSQTLRKKETDCFATRFVRDVGLAKLRKAGIITADGTLTKDVKPFPPEIAGEYADAFLGCVDFQKRYTDETMKVEKTLKLDRKTLQACVEKEMPDSFMRKLIVAAQTQSPDSTAIQEQASKKITDCKKQATKKP